MGCCSADKAIKPSTRLPLDESSETTSSLAESESLHGSESGDQFDDMGSEHSSFAGQDSFDFEEGEEVSYDTTVMGYPNKEGIEANYFIKEIEKLLFPPKYLNLSCPGGDCVCRKTDFEEAPLICA